MGVHIRWMIRRDMPAVLKIESQCFEFPWGDAEFIHCLQKHGCICMVAERDDSAVGFMIYELHKKSIHVLALAVGLEYQRKGIGRMMMSKLLNKLSNERRNRIVLEVRETNLAGQLFFKSQGFKAVSILRNHYDEVDDDAYLMQYRYKPTAEELQSPWYANAEPEVRK